MATFDQMVDDVLVYLRSFTRDQEQSTHLTSTLAVAGLQLEANDVALISRGRVEIDDELVWIDSVDRANNIATIAPYGRGMDGTTAIEHPSLSRIIVQPLYSRQMVRDTINQIIGGLGSQLFAIESATLTANPQTVSYDLPTYTQRVLNVLAADFSTYGDSEYVRRWKFDPQSAASSTNKSLYVYDPTMTGMKMYVTFFRSPVQLTTGNSFSDTLLPILPMT